MQIDNQTFTATLIRAGTSQYHISFSLKKPKTKAVQKFMLSAKIIINIQIGKSWQQMSHAE